MTQATEIIDAPDVAADDQTVDTAAVDHAVRLAISAERDRVIARLLPIAKRAHFCENFERCLEHVYRDDLPGLRARLIDPATGRDRNGRDAEGYNADGVDARGYNREGRYPRHDDEGVLRWYDQNGRDHDGYDYYGRDADGWNRRGIDRDGFNREGWRERLDYDGVRRLYDRDGYDQDGRDRHGRNRDGYDRAGFDREGWSLDLVHRDGYRRGSAEHRALYTFNRDGYAWDPAWEVQP